MTKHTAQGALIWETPADTIHGEVKALRSLAGGDVFVVGSAQQEQDRSSVLAARFSGADGRLLWRATLSPPNAGGAILEGSADTVALGPRGELVVGGYVRTEGGTSALVARLDPENGNSLWSWTTASTTVTDLSIDRRGNVLATGAFFLAVKLRGADGSLEWRIDTPSASLQERGYPQMRSLALDSKGNVTVGGSLRNVLEDSRSFYMTRLASATGRRLSETAGPALYSFESPVRVLSVGQDAFAAGRLNGEPAVLRRRARGGVTKWIQQPWSIDAAADRTSGVADLSSDSSGVYALGTDFAGRLMVTAYTSTGKARWTRDLGAGSGVRITAAARRLFLIGTLQSEDGVRSVLIGMETKSGLPVD
ncbi:MAG: PQQ-binding-like beta-propeller repeat protein [Actinomycetota bacterium]